MCRLRGQAAVLKAKQSLWELRVHHWPRLGAAARKELTEYFAAFTARSPPRGSSIAFLSF